MSPAWTSTDRAAEATRVHATDDDPRRARFEALYLAHHGAVRRYAMRRIDAAVVDDVVSETFTIAWRRLSSVPSEPLPWLFGVARRVLANQRRGQQRWERLVERLAATPEPGADDAELRYPPEQVRAALGRLSEADRELLMLTYWEGLDSAGAAAALARSRIAVRVALSRARKRLRLVLEDADPIPADELDLDHAPTR